MKVLHVAAELFPLHKVGGLGDVLAALPVALSELGEDVRILLPGFEELGARALDLEPLDAMDFPPGLWRGRSPAGIPLYLLDVPCPYPAGGRASRGQSGTASDLGMLARTASRLALEGDGQGWRPEVVHAHDWPAGLVPAHLAFGPRSRPATVFTIHNASYQGLFPRTAFHALGLPREADSMDGLEYHGKLSFLKAGLRYADKLTTVSPTYARELLSPEEGMGLDGLLNWRARDFVGIMNGVDSRTWNPQTDLALPRAYSGETLFLRDVNKRYLQQELGLEEDAQAVLLGVVSRLDAQKGLDLVLANLELIVREGGQLAVLGHGDAALESAFELATSCYPGRAAFARVHDEALAHRFFGAADLILVPSRFEPCGLTQLYAMRYGAVPVVRRTGGLADSVAGAGDAASATGFMFEKPAPEALGEALIQAMRMKRDAPSRFRDLQCRAMARDSGWSRPARAYQELYRTLLRDREGNHEQPRSLVHP